MKGNFIWILTGIVIANFLVPFYLTLKNPHLNREQKKKSFFRILFIMGIFTALALVWIYGFLAPKIKTP